MPKVSLAHFQPDRDLPLLTTWLNHPLAARWWGDPAQILHELEARLYDSTALIFADDLPVGILCWQKLTRSELEHAGLADLPADLIDVDILLGEPEVIGQGVGPEALYQLFANLSRNGIKHVGLATSLANTRAIGAFSKAGLLPYRDFVEDSESYRYFTKVLP